MHYVYILYSDRTDRYYVGYTGDIYDRIKRHNQQRSKATQAGVPWILVYTEQYETRQEAVSREREIKNKKSRKYIKKLILMVKKRGCSSAG